MYSLGCSTFWDRSKMTPYHKKQKKEYRSTLFSFVLNAITQQVE